MAGFCSQGLWKGHTCWQGLRRQVVFLPGQGLISSFPFRREHCPRNPMQADLSVIDAPSHSMSVCSAETRGLNVWDSLNDTTRACQTWSAPGVIPPTSVCNNTGVSKVTQLVHHPAPDSPSVSNQPSALFPPQCLSPTWVAVKSESFCWGSKYPGRVQESTF